MLKIPARKEDNTTLGQRPLHVFVTLSNFLYLCSYVYVNILVINFSYIYIYGLFRLKCQNPNALIIKCYTHWISVVEKKMSKSEWSLAILDFFFFFFGAAP